MHVAGVPSLNGRGTAGTPSKYYFDGCPREGCDKKLLWDCRHGVAELALEGPLDAPGFRAALGVLLDATVTDCWKQGYGFFCRLGTLNV